MIKCIKIGTIIVYCVIIFNIGVSIGTMQPKIGNNRQKFEIFQSYRFTSSDDNDTLIYVIVNERNYDNTDLFEEIREFHNKLNGEPNKMMIKLYNSRNDCKFGNCIGSKTYYKE